MLIAVSSSFADAADDLGRRNEHAAMTWVVEKTFFCS